MSASEALETSGASECFIDVITARGKGLCGGTEMTNRTYADREWSAAMKDLLRTQNELNRFLWSSELSYGLVMNSEDKRLTQRQAKVSDALSDVKANAWYPDTKGGFHYDKTIEDFLADIKHNTALCLSGGHCDVVCGF